MSMSLLSPLHVGSDFWTSPWKMLASEILQWAGHLPCLRLSGLDPWDPLPTPQPARSDPLSEKPGASSEHLWLWPQNKQPKQSNNHRMRTVGTH